MSAQPLLPLCLCALAAAAAAAAAATGPLPPVVLMNGLAGSVLHAKLDHVSTPHALCEQNSEWFKLWVSAAELLPGVIDCTFDNMKLVYNAAAKTYRNKAGVTIDGSVDWGGVGGLEYLDPGVTASGYFHDVVQVLRTRLNYTVNRTLRAAPYDWRLAPDGFSQVNAGAAYQASSYFDRLKLLVEETYALNGDAAVVLVSHSMGGPVAHAFLSREVSSEWKAKYIRGFIPFSPPFGGAVSTVEALVSGDTLGVPIVSHSLFHPIQSTCASGPWLFPQPSLWPENEVLVTSDAGKQVWTSKNYTEMTSALGLTQAESMFRNGLNTLLHTFDAPGVPTFVLRGTGVSTPARFDYADAFVRGKVPKAPASIVHETLGDGTVNGRSLDRARLWPETTYHVFQNTSHFGILMSELALGKLVEILESL
jgi:lysophospholipase-3